MPQYYFSVSINCKKTARENPPTVNQKKTQYLTGGGKKIVCSKIIYINRIAKYTDQNAPDIFTPPPLSFLF